MDGSTWASTSAGIVVIAVVVLDVARSVLHLGANGRVGAGVQRAVWRASVAVARRWPVLRRPLLAAAGPIMIVATHATWIGLFILGFALVYWPFPDQFQASDGVARHGFTTALYFSGSTGTVLGFGDITPLAPWLRIVSVIQAGMGFAILTATVTYLVRVVAGVAARTTLALRVHDESGGTGDGTELLLRSLETEGVDAARDRLSSLIAASRDLVESMHQFPVLDVFYRASDPRRDMEPMLRALAEAALAAHVVVQDPDLRRLRLVAEELRTVTLRMMDYIGRSYLSGRSDEREAAPTEEDAGRVDAVRAALQARLSRGFEFVSTRERDEAEALASRTRRFFADLERLTGLAA